MFRKILVFIKYKFIGPWIAHHTPGGDSSYILPYCILEIYIVYTTLWLLVLKKLNQTPSLKETSLGWKTIIFWRMAGRHSTQHSYFNGRGQPCWGFDDHYHHWSHLWTSKKHATNPALLSKLHYYNASAPSHSAAAMPSLPTQLWKNTLMGWAMSEGLISMIFRWFFFVIRMSVDYLIIILGVTIIIFSNGRGYLYNSDIA